MEQDPNPEPEALPPRRGPSIVLVLRLLDDPSSSHNPLDSGWLWLAAMFSADWVSRDVVVVSAGSVVSAGIADRVTGCSGFPRWICACTVVRCRWMELTGRTVASCLLLKPPEASGSRKPLSNPSVSIHLLFE